MGLIVGIYVYVGAVVYLVIKAVVKIFLDGLWIDIIVMDIKVMII